MNATCFRQRRSGPEIIIEDSVAKQIPSLFPCEGSLSWMAKSLSLGTSVPDLLIVVCNPQISSLPDLGLIDAHILSYLRSVGRARIDTIIDRIGVPQKKILHCMRNLIEVEIIIDNSPTYSLSPKWRNILSEIISVEAKVKNWKEAVDQAIRNRIFAHKSYVALPSQIAGRIHMEKNINRFGLGIISVDDDGVRITRRARQHPTRVWAYYYKLAFVVANHVCG